jgi:hypothetical protein
MPASRRSSCSQCPADIALLDRSDSTAAFRAVLATLSFLQSQMKSRALPDGAASAPAADAPLPPVEPACSDEDPPATAEGAQTPLASRVRRAVSAAEVSVFRVGDVLPQTDPVSAAPAPAPLAVVSPTTPPPLSPDDSLALSPLSPLPPSASATMSRRSGLGALSVPQDVAAPEAVAVGLRPGAGGSPSNIAVTLDTDAGPVLAIIPPAIVSALDPSLPVDLTPPRTPAPPAPSRPGFLGAGPRISQRSELSDTWDSPGLPLRNSGADQGVAGAFAAAMALTTRARPLSENRLGILAAAGVTVDSIARRAPLAPALSVPPGSTAGSTMLQPLTGARPLTEGLNVPGAAAASQARLSPTLLQPRGPGGMSRSSSPHEPAMDDSYLRDPSVRRVVVLGERSVGKSDLCRALLAATGKSGAVEFCAAEPGEEKPVRTKTEELHWRLEAIGTVARSEKRKGNNLFGVADRVAVVQVRCFSIWHTRSRALRAPSQRSGPHRRPCPRRSRAPQP